MASKSIDLFTYTYHALYHHREALIYKQRKTKGKHAVGVTVPAEKLDVTLVVCDGGPLVDQRDGKLFSQMGGITRHEGRAGSSRAQPIQFL